MVWWSRRFSWRAADMPRLGAGFDEATCLLSDKDESCRLDKEGMFQLRFKHSIFRRHFANINDCEFYGPLNSDEATRLQEFWDRVNFG